MVKIFYYSKQKIELNQDQIDQYNFRIYCNLSETINDSIEITFVENGFAQILIDDERISFQDASNDLENLTYTLGRTFDRKYVYINLKRGYNPLIVLHEIFHCKDPIELDIDNYNIPNFQIIVERNSDYEKFQIINYYNEFIAQYNASKYIIEKKNEFPDYQKFILDSKPDLKIHFEKMITIEWNSNIIDGIFQFLYHIVLYISYWKSSLDLNNTFYDFDSEWNSNIIIVERSNEKIFNFLQSLKELLLTNDPFSIFEEYNEKIMNFLDFF